MTPKRRKSDTETIYHGTRTAFTQLGFFGLVICAILFFPAFIQSEEENPSVNPSVKEEGHELEPAKISERLQVTQKLTFVE
jgi:hypothetical protein